MLINDVLRRYMDILGTDKKIISVLENHEYKIGPDWYSYKAGKFCSGNKNIDGPPEIITDIRHVISETVKSKPEKVSAEKTKST